MRLAAIINSQIARWYLKRSDLTEFLNFQYPTLALQWAGFVNEFCYQLNIPFAPYVRSAAFEPTNRCNLRCVTCPNSVKEIRKKGFMDFAMYKAILEASPYLDMVQLNGWGEPFLHPQIIEFILYAKSKGKRVYLYSNGTLINEARSAEVIKSGLDRIVISLDGVGKTYERIRGYPYSKIENQILSLIEKRDKMKSPLIIDVSMVGSKNTEGAIDEFKAQWKDRVSQAQVLSYFEHTPKLRRTKCRELWRGNPQVLWDGTVSPCCVDWDGELVFARVDRDGYSLQKLWNGEKMMNARHRHIKKIFHSTCSRCNEYSSERVTNRFGT